MISYQSAANTTTDYLTRTPPPASEQLLTLAEVLCCFDM